MSRGQSNTVVWAAALIGLALFGGHMVLGITVGEDYAIPSTIIGAIAAAVILRGPIGLALGRRIQGAEPSELPPEQVLNELDELRSRISELEERTDFSERLLAQQREGERLPGK